MRDLRCVLGMHKYVRKQIEDSQFLECQRCGRDKPAHVHKSPMAFG
jgi:hypothetical protein